MNPPFLSQLVLLTQSCLLLHVGGTLAFSRSSSQQVPIVLPPPAKSTIPSHKSYGNSPQWHHSQQSRSRSRSELDFSITNGNDILRSEEHVHLSNLPAVLSLRSSLHASATTSATSATTSTTTTTLLTTVARPKKRLALCFSFLTGYADYLLLTKYKVFCTMMTGNSMYLGAALVEARWKDLAFYATVISAYIFGVGTFQTLQLKGKLPSNTTLHESLAKREKDTRTVDEQEVPNETNPIQRNAVDTRFIYFAPLVCACLIGSDVLTWRDARSRWIPAVLLSYAWGIINSVGNEITGNPIFVVTGAMTKLSNSIVTRTSSTAVRVSDEETSTDRKKNPTTQKKENEVLMSLSIIGGFTLGAMWSVYLSHAVPSLKAFGGFSILGGIYGSLFVWLDRMIIRDSGCRNNIGKGMDNSVMNQ